MVLKLVMDTNALITVCKFSVEGDPLIKLILGLCHIIIPSAVKEEAIVAKDIYKDANLASDFINKEEIPALKRRRQQEGMLLMPILISPCTWEAIEWLKGIQMFPKDGISLDEISPRVEQEKKLY